MIRCCRPKRRRRSARRSRSRRTQDGYPVHSFRTLLAVLGTQCRDTCQFGDASPVIEIGKLSEPTPLQTEAFRLLEHECSQQA